jgi:hypothetical protein
MSWQQQMCSTFKQNKRLKHGSQNQLNYNQQLSKINICWHLQGQLFLRWHLK